ncbi:gamma-glutamyltransferase family protein [Serinibacter salmoneus]|uniref:gamma-glutamyltransferase family protein n=1 Tax=Serinibacter salmoneus TaxID=556530 RepID=UPI003CCB998C
MADTFTTRPDLTGTFGMVASTHWLASTSGMAILEEGGNAFDAAIAAGLVLHVVEPHLNGLGGDMPLLLRQADASSAVVCGQGAAPAAATIAAYRDLGVDLIPGTGHLAAVVPGTFGAWMHLLATRGTLPLARLARFAIGYARGGHPLLPSAARTIETMAPLFAEHWPTSAAIYLQGGGAPRPGTLLRNPDLADTLERLVAAAEAAGSDVAAQAEAARAAFYEGVVAERIDAFAAQQVYDGAGHYRSFLTGADLASWRASEEPPAEGRLGSHTILKPGLWSQGPVLLQQLALLQQAGGATAQAWAGEADPATVHLAIEATKLALADREAWYGERSPVSVADLLGADYLRERAALVGERADLELRPGSVGGHAPRLAGHVRRAMTGAGAWPGGMADSRPGEGEPTVPTTPRGDTCHLDVVDRWGNAVAATPSGGWLQSSPVIPGLGFALPTRAQMFWLEPGLPASLEPGARPRTTLSPGIAVGDDGSVLAFGTPGGDQQDQWTVPFLLRHLVGGQGAQAAIDAPTWHSMHVPSSFAPRAAEPGAVRLESRVGEAVLEDLHGRGHRVQAAGEWELGRISAAGIRADGVRHAAANPRGMQGYAVGR